MVFHHVEYCVRNDEILDDYGLFQEARHIRKLTGSHVTVLAVDFQHTKARVDGINTASICKFSLMYSLPRAFRLSIQDNFFLLWAQPNTPPCLCYLDHSAQIRSRGYLSL